MLHQAGMTCLILVRRTFYRMERFQANSIPFYSNIFIALKMEPRISNSFKQNPSKREKP